MFQALLPERLTRLSEDETDRKIAESRERLGKRLVVLGHHYQRDEVIKFADLRGDSFKLAQWASEQKDAEFILFCGVHFMAESADILSAPYQKVVLPDLSAGCSMADMAALDQVEACWDELERATTETIIPITYMNSAAGIKAFCGRHGGAVCTSSNAPAVMRWALERGHKILFLPDQHLGRNTAVLSLGLGLDDCVVYDPWQPRGGLSDEELQAAKVILWKGHCSVHARFQPEMIDQVRTEHPDVEVYVHPECRHEVVLNADKVGSTSQIIRWVEDAAPGATIAIATELNLVKRLGDEHPDKQVMFLDDTVCFCATMNRIDLPHLVWVLESLVAGEVVNEVRVPDDVRAWSRVALERMLALPGADTSLNARD
jgi:quinolinate synthase